MRLQLSLQSITAQKPIAQKLLIKVIVNGSIEFKSDWSERKKDNVFPFFEKNVIRINDSQLNYIKFQIQNELKYLVSEKTVLNEQARNKKQIDFMISKDKVKLKLKYSLIQTISEEDISLSFKKKLTLQQEPQIMKSNQGKLEILKLGSNVYNFSQRLDPVIWLVNEAEQVISWRSPSLTIGVGVFLTFVIMNLKISLVLGTIFLIFGKNKLIKKIQKINKKKNFHKRLWVPKENTIFLQSCITNYNYVYEKIHQFCLNEDKTQVVNLIHHICQASMIAFILLFVFSIEKLIVVTLWSLILLASPSGIKFFQQIWPSFLYFEKQTEKVTDALAGYFKIAIGQNYEAQISVIKQFYFFQYERWFMGKGWLKPLGLLQYHFADQSGKIQLLPKLNPPDGWEWISEHQVDYMQIADHNGYQYTNELSKKFTMKCSFATLRRRKFIRKCKLIMKKDKKPVQTI